MEELRDSKCWVKKARFSQTFSHISFHLTVFGLMANSVHCMFEKGGDTENITLALADILLAKF